MQEGSAPPAIFPKVTIIMLLTIAPMETPGTRHPAVTKIPIFATQCSNPLTTNPEIHITIIKNFAASLLSLMPQRTPRHTKKLHTNCTEKHLTCRNCKFISDKSGKIICCSGCSRPYKNQRKNQTANKVTDIADYPYFSRIAPS